MLKKPPGIAKNTKYEPTLLDEYINRHGLTVGGLARLVGVDKTSIQAWRVGSGLPSLPAAFRLEEVTQTEVPASSWLATSIGKHAYFTMKEKADAASKKS